MDMMALEVSCSSESMGENNPSFLAFQEKEEKV